MPLFIETDQVRVKLDRALLRTFELFMKRLIMP
jgi:hypothetical protein